MSDEQTDYNLSMTEELRRARNFDELADKIEPFAQSMALLADDLREEAKATKKTTKESANEMLAQMRVEFQDVIADMHTQTKAMEAQSKTNQALVTKTLASVPKSTNWWQILGCTASGLLLGMVASWLWLNPSEIDLNNMRMGEDLSRMMYHEQTTKAQRQSIREVMERAGWRFDEPEGEP